MFHYLFTNDLRISNLEDVLIQAGKCFVENRVPSATEDKNLNNNMNTLGFYFNLTKESNCAHLCSNGNIRQTVLNFIKKFQFPNPRTTESLNDAINDGILIAPLRVIIKALYIMNMINKEEAYLTDKEIADYIFFNDKVAKNPNHNVFDLANNIIAERNNEKSKEIEDDEILKQKGFYWKQCKRQIREMVKVLCWSGCVIRDEKSRIKIQHDKLTTEDKAEIFDILSYSSYWYPEKSKTANESKESYQKYMDIPNIEKVAINSINPYSKEDFLNDVYINENEYEELKDLLLFKKNIILEGAPGVGKTFMAKRLVYSIIGTNNKKQIKEQVMCIQFHQSYSYEEFIEGIMPSSTGEFLPQNGIFKEFCNKASKEYNKDKKYFFIIDEINRGNISKIFGELMVLIESDKRDQEMTLTYSKSNFKVPENLYIIGMMNTADRSLALMDYALRRRFDFYPVLPAFDNPNFIEYIKSFNSSAFEKLIEVVKKLNKSISEDEALGSGFMIGHSYFCNLQKYKGDISIKLKQIIKYSIIPLIKEYWYDDESNKIELWKKELYGAINE